ncbi:hypothetical protein EHO60_14400 [Leptospira fletcheri]|uniref:Uncharacterized protein n=2 Tax=Leptospira fletcheri TaxID=2484981 RepID=A0A4R9GAR7_9LEPT|nr:hypothetical protein EHO60_14400 [Leptospira fletcheri]
MSENAMGSLVNQASLQLSGFGTKEGLDNLRTLADFDILVSGDLSLRSNDYLLTIKAVKRTSRAEGFEVFLSETIPLVSYQFDYYADEIAKKVKDVKYSINKLNAPKPEEISFEIPKIKLNAISPEKIEAYNFSTGDTNLSALTDKINEYLLTADRLLAQKKYRESIEIYSKSASSIRSLSAEYQNQLQGLLTYISQKTDNAYFGFFQAKISVIDVDLNREISISQAKLDQYFESYKELSSQILEEKEYKNKVVILENLRSRIAEVKLASMKYMEKEADEEYRKLNFSIAYSLYKKANDDAKEYLTFPKKNPTYENYQRRIEQKVQTTSKSANLYVENTLNGLLELAESENARGALDLSLDDSGYKEHINKSVLYLQKARAILKQYDLFAPYPIKSKFNVSVSRINAKNSTIRDYSILNIALFPFKYFGNILKGVVDIFVLKVGYGIGAGVELGILGTGLGIAKMPIEISTAYGKQGSKISSISHPLKNWPNDDFPEVLLRDGKKGPRTIGMLTINANTCYSVLLRKCEEASQYSNINFWVGVGPALHFSIETHRILELFGVLLFQDLHLIPDENRRFQYFSFPKAENY